MKLVSLRLVNFRGYADCTVHFDNMTAIVGRNDAGKSTILEALEIFFGAAGAKVDVSDKNKFTMASALEIRCTFTDLPTELVLDTAAVTTLAGEFLLNHDGNLEIGKRWRFGGKTQIDTFAHAMHPTNPAISDLLDLKIDELRKRAEAASVTVEDKRKSPMLRKALYDSVNDKVLEERDILLTDGDGKKIWQKLEDSLPMFYLFSADRSTSDEDAEAQDPMSIAVKKAIAEVQDKLESIASHVRDCVQEVAQRTLDELRGIDTTLAKGLAPEFRGSPKWDTLFKISLTGDQDIPINKRGSGVRRMILLSFLLAEAHQERLKAPARHIIYAIEEPETALHPKQQTLLVSTLMRLAGHDGTQVLVTTHSPQLAAILPFESIRLVTKGGADAVAMVSYGPEVAHEAARELGILPHPDSQKVRVVVCVEGPTDVAFLSHASSVVRLRDPKVPDLSGADPRILVIPLGGATLKHWVERHYLRNLGVREVHVYDRDTEAPPKYEQQVNSVNARTDGSRAFLTLKRELENYYSSTAIATALGIATGINLTYNCDVPMVVAEPVYEARNPGKIWANAGAKLKSNCAKNIKAEMAEKVIPLLTYECLEGTLFVQEFSSWCAPIAEAISAG